MRNVQFIFFENLYFKLVHATAMQCSLMQNFDFELKWCVNVYVYYNQNVGNCAI